MTLQVTELACRQGRIGRITLDAPARLNALTEGMLDELAAVLARWAVDDSVCVILIDGNGEGGLCAGGDIVDLYAALSAGDTSDTPTRWFSKEYRLMYHLHRYPKPVIGWGHRVVMGAGMGLLSACRYRLVSADLMMAMPEIGIGLFPDVGASYFLNRLPDGLGLFLALTGARLNATDALRVGLADQPVHNGGKPALLAALQQQHWSGDPLRDDSLLSQLLDQLDTPAYHSLPASELARHEQTIARLCGEGRLTDIVARLLAEPAECAWWQAGMANLRAGCPVSACLAYEQLQRGRHLPLKEVLAMELILAVRCCQHPDLVSGIRSRLIERGSRPVWSYPSVAEVPADYIGQHFVAPWSDHHDPLALS
ncbi:enoyl-CoA hydratase/isomerase family protein [Marinobacter sp. X15-166B]|uniref:enoyl-CoA hydratase/isomerase family protein n=1 Tax=Marinobacter sp. X15-166B TaxID=1897620 RepID=UPI00085CA3BC|nr:enoyl-CoA hydratase/isomerase family protein [Marinobacter sp. X15-166B]OEY65792.1 enoyl-CoA hydratase [Marinobacter sp. X15-166B]